MRQCYSATVTTILQYFVLKNIWHNNSDLFEFRYAIALFCLYSCDLTKLVLQEITIRVLNFPVI